MKSFINFRDFGKVQVNFSYYDSGNLKIEVFYEEIKLCELTQDLFKMPFDMFIVKNTGYTNEILKEFFKEDFIKSYAPVNLGDTTVYVCSLGKKAFEILAEQKTQQYRRAAG